jgi:hypothetical protein
MVDSVQIFPPGFRVTDNSTGAPVSGAKIKVFDATTTTPKTVYSDSALSSSLGTTVYCDSEGTPVASFGSSTAVMVYTGTAAYKVVITDADDNIIHSLDNIKGALDTSTFLTTGSTSTLSQPVITKTSNYTIVAADRSKLIEANTTGGQFTLTLTAAATLGDGWSCKVRNSGTANQFLLSASENIYFEGETFTTRAFEVGESAEIICDGTSFRLLGHDSGIATASALPPPQGYLTLTSGTPIITADVISAAAVYYTPYVGNFVPIYDGSILAQTLFSELTLTLSGTGHALNTIYDVFAFIIPATTTVQIGTGPAWATSTAGAGDRGTGAGTTELTRVGGLLTNAQSMTARNGGTTYTIPANQATYLGSIFIDGTAGQVTCHRSWGQSRKSGVWNAYNRQRIYLQAGDSTASWNYTTGTIRASNNSSANSLTTFCGLAEEFYDLRFGQTIQITTADAANTEGSNAIGWNSTTAISGRRGIVGEGGGGQDLNDVMQGNGIAEFLQVPNLGINVVTALETALAAGNTVTWLGGQDDMILSAMWMG